MKLSQSPHDSVFLSGFEIFLFSVANFYDQVLTIILMMKAS